MASDGPALGATAKRPSPGSGSDEPAAKRLRAAGLTEEKKTRLGLTDDQVGLLALAGNEVEELKAADVQRWVAAALIAGGQEGSIKDESSDVGEVVAVLKKQKVTGAALVNLTLEELMADGIARGPAKVLAARIAGLRAPAAERTSTSVTRFLEALGQHRHDEALAALGEHRVDDDEYCSPKKVPETWNKNMWGEILAKKSREIDWASTQPRAPRCLGLHAGTGAGKSHSLLEAPGAMQDHLAKEAKDAGREAPPAQQAVYIAYNQNQALAMDIDRHSAQTAIILRVLLRLMGVSNRTCDRALSEQHARRGDFQELSHAALQALVAHCSERVPLFIAVDECRNLGDCVMLVSSALGELAKKLWTEKNVWCTVLMAALTDDTFKTASDRAIQPIERPVPNDDAHDFIRDQQLPNATEQQRAIIKAVAGNHFRSIVEACSEVAVEITVHQLTLKLADGFRSKLNGEEACAVRGYSKAVVQCGVDDACASHHAAAKFSDTLGAVPPALVCHVFAGQDCCAELEHPAQKLFKCSAFVPATKQLEQCGMEYDRFRALYGLPVVPHGMAVGNPGARGLDWFRALRFDEAVARATDTFDLFRVNDKEVRRTTNKPRICAYCFPSSVSHPIIDRACMAYHKDSNETCLVIYQDKINKNSFGEAMRALEDAAGVLQKELKIPVLVVAQVIGASQRTRAQERSTRPFILVRDGEVGTFYTPTFAPAVRFVRERHSLG